MSFWARPRIAAILAPARAETSRRPESPHEYLQSILRQAGELSGPLRPLGAHAAEAARQLIASIEHADRQISELARNLDPGEEDRLAEKIDALAGVEEYAAMRALLEKQRELMREMSGRIEQAKERRSRHVEMLKTLALHVASLRERQTPTPSEVRLLSDNVRALCDEIERHAGGLAAEETASAREAAQMPTVERT
ncbi:MAG TPA: hypothetical protein VMS56_06420 [Thermoanaerobaculia bacterium]|nr:hypothetical protein [Thermoanaerobaculia bacterium]